MRSHCWWKAGLCLSIAVALADFAPAQQHRVLEAAAVPKDPFVVNNGLIPTPAQYKGPFFKLSHNWPRKPLPPLSPLHGRKRLAAVSSRFKTLPSM
jgi:hypothetical protein